MRQPWISWSARWVHDWLKRYDQGGLEGLRDLPRPGRPRSVPPEKINEIIDGMILSGCTPVALQERIREESGVKLHITYVRKLMCKRGLSPKVPKRVHINRANKKAVQNWKYRFNKRVSRLEKDDFT